jgi:DNA-binding transcriptional LysR family regulator
MPGYDFRNGQVVVLPIAHPLAGETSFDIKDLRTEDFILYPFRLGPDIERFSFRMQVVNLCGEAGYTPQVAQEATQLHTIIRLVEAGFGISLVPEWTKNYFSSQVVYRNLVSDSNWSRITLSAAWNPRNRSPVLDRLLEVIAKRSSIETIEA